MSPHVGGKSGGCSVQPAWEEIWGRIGLPPRYHQSRAVASFQCTVGPLPAYLAGSRSSHKSAGSSICVSASIVRISTLASRTSPPPQVKSYRSSIILILTRFSAHTVGPSRRPREVVSSIVKRPSPSDGTLRLLCWEQRGNARHLASTGTLASFPLRNLSGPPHGHELGVRQRGVHLYSPSTGQQLGRPVRSQYTSDAVNVNTVFDTCSDRHNIAGYGMVIPGTDPLRGPLGRLEEVHRAGHDLQRGAALADVGFPLVLGEAPVICRAYRDSRRRRRPARPGR